jgi:hypothetical protein
VKIYNMLTSSGPQVSVLMCVKDAAATIRGSLDSLDGQTYRNFELIVIDGGSQDGTQQVVQDFGSLVSVFLSEPDKGYYDALNKAFARTKGDFVLVVNGDDALQPHAIERLVETAVTDGADIAAAHARTMDAEGRFTGELPSFWSAAAAIHCPLRHGAMLASRRLCERVGPYDTEQRIISDWLWMQKALALGASVSIVDEYLLYFRTTGVSSGVNPVHVSEVDQCLKELEPILPKAKRELLHSPWKIGADNLVALCREFPLAGRLRQALLAARMAKGSRSTWPAITVAAILNGSSERLETFLEAIQRQSFSNYEVLFCGSPSEGETKLLRQAASKDLRLQLITCGSTSPIQTALLQAVGDYLVFPTLESVWRTDFLKALHQEALNNGALLLADTKSDRRNVVRCESGSVLYEDGWLPDFFLAQPATASMAGIFAAREVYKPAIDWIGFWKNEDQSEACGLSIFVTAAFSLFATKVNTLHVDAVRLRNRALGEALRLCDTDRCSLQQKDPELAEKLISAASRIFTETVVHNHRLGKNTRLRLVSDWNKAMRDMLNVRGATRVAARA